MRFVRAVAVSLVVLVLFAIGFARLTDNDRPAIVRPRLGRALSGLSITTATKVRLSPDGGRVLVVEAGQVVVVGLHDADIVMRAGRNVVDAAWMPDGERVLVVEGPIPTAQVTTLDMNGEVDGVQTLSPSVGFGDGNGVAVDSRGTKAAVIATTRDAIGGRVHGDLAVIELQTGKVRVYATPDRDEVYPLFVDDDLVALRSEAATGATRLDLVELATGAVTVGRPMTGGPFVRTVGGEVVVARRGAKGATRLVGVDTQTGKERQIHVTKSRSSVVAVDLRVTRCLVRVVDSEGNAHLAIEPFA